MQEPDDMAQAAKNNPRAFRGISEAVANQAVETTHCFYCGNPGETLCDPCDAKAVAKNAEINNQQERERQARRTAWFNDRVPELYRNTDELLVPRWVREIESAWNPQDRYGVTFVGPSNTWKTRAATKLLHKAFQQGRAVEFRQAGDLRREINRLARDGADSALLKTLCEIPAMLLDEVGNQAFTEASEEFMLALFEGRSNRNLPTLVTSQFPSDEFLLKFSNRRIGTAIAKRMGPEYSWIINTGTGAITPPQQPTPRYQ